MRITYRGYVFDRSRAAECSWNTTFPYLGLWYYLPSKCFDLCRANCSRSGTLRCLGVRYFLPDKRFDLCRAGVLELALRLSVSLSLSRSPLLSPSPPSSPLAWPAFTRQLILRHPRLMAYRVTSHVAPKMTWLRERLGLGQAALRKVRGRSTRINNPRSCTTYPLSPPPPPSADRVDF